MKKWPSYVQKILDSVAEQKNVGFELFDKQTNQTVFTSERLKNKLPGVQIIKVRFSI